MEFSVDQITLKIVMKNKLKKYEYIDSELKSLEEYILYYTYLSLLKNKPLTSYIVTQKIVLIFVIILEIDVYLYK